MKPTIGLCMIVKDEAHVIARCLASVRSVVDHWLIVDTGSTDRTEDVVRAALEGIPGRVVRRPWRDFGHNRSEALALAREHADYSLVIDADDVLEITSWPRGSMIADAYSLKVLDHGTSYERPHIFKNTLPWRYEGVVHEYAHCPSARKPTLLDGVVYRRLSGGARSSNGDKFLRDAAILERALANDPTHARNTFYLAQSYYDAGAFERALLAYRRRLSLGGWEEEIYFSRLRIAKVLEVTNAPPMVVTAAYLDAYKSRPQRAESLCELARYHRLRDELPLAYLFAQAAAATSRPNDHLFVDDTVYEWRALDELAVAAARIGDLDAAQAAHDALAGQPSVPDAHRERIAKNLEMIRSMRAGRAAA
jgi:glycosyltransferase involved in cell wall biosynthesis